MLNFYTQKNPWRDTHTFNDAWRDQDGNIHVQSDGIAASEPQRSEVVGRFVEAEKRILEVAERVQQAFIGTHLHVGTPHGTVIRVTELEAEVLTHQLSEVLTSLVDKWVIADFNNRDDTAAVAAAVEQEREAVAEWLESIIGAKWSARSLQARPKQMTRVRMLVFGEHATPLHIVRAIRTGDHRKATQPSETADE